MIDACVDSRMVQLTRSCDAVDSHDVVHAIVFPFAIDDKRAPSIGLEQLLL